MDNATQWNPGKMSLGKRLTQFRLLTFNLFSFPVLLEWIKAYCAIIMCEASENSSEFAGFYFEIAVCALI